MCHKPTRMRGARVYDLTATWQSATSFGLAHPKMAAARLFRTTENYCCSWAAS
jgi:hypothetical protein